MASDFKEAAKEAATGAKGFGEFARRTAKRWKWWASRLARSYKLPAWFSPEDVEQELLLEAWRVMPRFDSSRGPDLGRFVEWNAVKRATKAVQKAQGVEQHRRKGSGRPEVLVGGESGSLPEITHDPWRELDRQEERAEMAKILSLLAIDEVEREVMNLMAQEGSMDEAAAAIYACPVRCLRFEIGSEAAAHKLVGSVLENMTGRFQPKEASITK